MSDGNIVSHDVRLQSLLLLLSPLLTIVNAVYAVAFICIVSAVHFAVQNVSCMVHT